MGGQAFSRGSKNLNTPRMPAEVYRYMKNKIRDDLSLFFPLVAVPVEAPEKTDYGDIDFIVAAESDSFHAAGSNGGPQAEDIWQRFGVEHGDGPREIVHKVLKPEHVISGQTINYAVPWPEGFQIPAPAISATDDTAAVTAPAFVQVDVAICASQAAAEWRLFKHAHGDLWNMLGAVIRPFGLTVDEKALYVRVPEIEKLDKKRARVFLSSTPRDVLRFLGLEGMDESDAATARGDLGDARKRICWDEPFPSVDALFEYVASCSLFDEYAWRLKRLEERDAARAAAVDDFDDQDMDSIPEAAWKGAAARAFRERSLKANDRKRKKQRTVFRRFVDEFVPAYISARRAEQQQKQQQHEAQAPEEDKENNGDDDNDDESISSRTQVTRRAVRQRAFDFFPGAEERYNDALADFKATTTNFEVARFLKEYRPPGYYSLVQERMQGKQDQRAESGGATSSSQDHEDKEQAPLSQTPKKDLKEIHRQQQRRGLTAAAFRKILTTTDKSGRVEALEILREAGLLPQPQLIENKTTDAEPEADVTWGVGTPWTALKDPTCPGAWNVPATTAWIVANWDRVGDVAVRRANEQYIAMKVNQSEGQEAAEGSKAEPKTGNVAEAAIVIVQDEQLTGPAEDME